MKVTGQGCGKQADSGVEVERQLSRPAPGRDLDQFVNEITVGLEKRTGADAVGGLFRPVHDVGCAYRNQFLWCCPRLAVAKCRYARDLRQGGTKIFRPGTNL